MAHLAGSSADPTYSRAGRALFNVLTCVDASFALPSHLIITFLINNHYLGITLRLTHLSG